MMTLSTELERLENSIKEGNGQIVESRLKKLYDYTERLTRAAGLEEEYPESEPAGMEIGYDEEAQEAFLKKRFETGEELRLYIETFDGGFYGVVQTDQREEVVNLEEIDDMLIPSPRIR